MAGKYQAYPEYKDCSFPLIKQIPNNWSEQKVKFQLSDCVAGGTPESGNELFWTESGDGTPWVSIADMTRSTLITRTEKDVTDRGIYSKGLKIVPKGSLLYSIFASLGKVSEAGVDLTTNQAILALIQKETLNKAFFRYWLQSMERYLMYYSTSNTQNNLNSEKVGNLPIFIPSHFEQVNIGCFLDHETAKIDTLIDKQQQLIQLLKEKRQAVISHAVTKGLNPNAPMRDSGVEWLGEVPEHWELPKLIHQTSRIGDGLHATPLYQDNTGYYFVNGNNLVNGQILVEETAKEVPEEEYKKHYIYLDESSVLLSINGTIGNVARYNNEMVILGKSAAYMNCSGDLLPGYLMLYLQSSQALHYFDLEVTGTTIFNLSLNSIRQMKVCVPPKHDQLEINQYCKLQKNKYDTLIEKASAAIRLMQERRTALISAAVTGKIDVRSWVAPSILSGNISGNK